MTDAILALDSGQTGTKVRMEAPGEAPIEFTLDGVRTNEKILPQLADFVREARGRVDRPVGVVTFGVSGLTEDDADAPRLQEGLTGLGVTRVVLAHDSVTSFLGALGDRRGAVIAAGTGVVTLAVGQNRVARVDGWGNIMGDAGSGYWIGREALDAVMRDHDGRGPATALTDAVRERWPDLEAAYIDLQNDPDRVRVVASFSAAVTRLAPSDSVAARICLGAARELAHSTAVALERVAEPDDERGGAVPTVAAIGGVFRSDLIRTRFAELLRESVDVELVEPAGHGIDGAVSLSRLDASHPLHALVSDTL